MVRNFKGAVLVGALALCMSMATGRAEDEKEVQVKIGDVPAVVKDALVAAAGGATIDSVEKEGDGATATYEADVKIDGKPYEIKVGADGKLISKKLDNDDDDKGEKGGAGDKK